MKGKLIVFEGIDGCGKATQSKLLIDKLKRKGKKTAFINFPKYDSTFGKLVEGYLKGRFGSKEKVPPEIASLLYAIDRYQFKNWIFERLKKGITIIADRYSQSNLAFQSTKLKKRRERIKFVKWLEAVDSRMPQADVVILLDIDPSISKKAVKRRGRGEDIHEKDFHFQREVRKQYLKLAKKRGWIVIKCMRNKKWRTRLDINEEVWKTLKERNLI